MSADPRPDPLPISELKARIEAERSGRPFLVFRNRDDRQQLFFLEPGPASVSVGRLPSSDLTLDWDHQVSRVHARFDRADDGWILVDDGFSSNGTFVNEERLRGSRHLSDGDTMRFGTTTLTFRAPGRVQPDTADVGPVQLSTTQRRVLVALCRAQAERRGLTSPPADEQIAEELVLSVDEVRAHLKVLYAKLGVQELPETERRHRLVEQVIVAGLISERDF